MACARLCILVLLCSMAGPALSDVFKYVDAQGNVIFTDKPVVRKDLNLAWQRPTKSLTDENQRAQRRVLAYNRVISSGKARRKESFAGRRADYDEAIRSVALRYRLAPALLHAVIRAESAYDAGAVSQAGAIGLMQLIPATAKRYNVRDIRDPVDNLRGGAAYLRDLLDLFDQDLSLALAGYNAGENAVIRYGRKIPPYPETQTYVRKVLQFYWAEQAALTRLAVR
ncbi:soluble lytic murein transglycosylase-like protein [Thioflavicoccus mobilis 8321]|uniref:Soluble lytic murein transglycosylase-like protein n=1 Tax=Thioflavicoccus mobilis 8321 TaxID=765912 RepID=L0GXJ4_9GAMM|nr:lytic transglycosylase domain-containing protein [Thioflavicoccus mobilis]AGA90716.1 soluble lytic murein transglycosylase-like protein [Thioflavicoccus mobilis 8321]